MQGTAKGVRRAACHGAHVTTECLPARRRPAPRLNFLPQRPRQAYEPNYRWDKEYRLNQDELTKGSGAATQQVGPRRKLAENLVEWQHPPKHARVEIDGLLLLICSCADVHHVPLHQLIRRSDLRPVPQCRH